MKVSLANVATAAAAFGTHTAQAREYRDLILAAKPWEWTAAKQIEADRIIVRHIELRFGVEAHASKNTGKSILSGWCFSDNRERQALKFARMVFRREWGEAQLAKQANKGKGKTKTKRAPSVASLRKRAVLPLLQMLKSKDERQILAVQQAYKQLQLAAAKLHIKLV